METIRITDYITCLKQIKKHKKSFKLANQMFPLFLNVKSPVRLIDYEGNIATYRRDKGLFNITVKRFDDKFLDENGNYLTECSFFKWYKDNFK